jgi:heat shock protein HslJ
MAKSFLSFGVCAGLFLITACALSPSQQSGVGDLAGPVWSLSTLSDQDLVPDTSITARFTLDGKVSVSAGCNLYSGTFTNSGNSIQISSPLASTLMACSPEIMEQENSYLTILGEVRAFTVAGDQLTLSDGNNKILLVYNAQSQELSGTSWEATGYNNGRQAVTSVLAGSTITAEFGKDGNLSGNSGCNSYNGTYKVTGSQIEIGPLASTRMACGDPVGVMEQEAQYLAALESAATYQIEGTRLELRTEDGALAVDYTKK